VLRQLLLGSLADGGIFVVLLGGVVAVLAIVLLATYVVRPALVILLIVAGPICLVCHALPQTEGLARLWWRAFAGTVAVQVAQSLVLITALRVFLASAGAPNLGIASAVAWSTCSRRPACVGCWSRSPAGSAGWCSYAPPYPPRLTSQFAGVEASSGFIAATPRGQVLAFFAPSWICTGR
jgi:hypothetical protein